MGLITELVGGTYQGLVAREGTVAGWPVTPPIGVCWGGMIRSRIGWEEEAIRDMASGEEGPQAVG